MVDQFRSAGSLSRRDIIAGALASAISTQGNAAAPTGIVSIIDLYGGDSIEPERAKASGVVAMIHKATEGSDFRDRKYSKRRAAAKQLGLLWGSFHFSNDSNTSRQVANYLGHAEIAQEDLVCLDFEHNKGQEMSLEQAHEFIGTIHEKVGRYPVLYGGAWLREQVGEREDPIFAKCPLWYRRYAPLPKAIPKQIWPTYTLWQYTDGNADYGGPPRSVNGLTCDRNLFDGSLDELQRRWPFT